MDNNNKPTLCYSIGEEVANAITHGLGALLAIAGCAILVVLASFTGDSWKIVSSCIYGASMIILYTSSTLYHSLTNKKAKGVFRIFDHASIFILIAGSYTPMTLITLRGTMGWILFAIVWLSAIIGIILNAISVDKYKKPSLICYLASGWAAIFAIVPLYNALDLFGFILLVAGGLFYTFGVIFYKQKKRYMHSIWHVFVLAGTVCHYFCILFFVILK